MSRVQTHTIPCPSCGEPSPMTVIDSINADRRPDLRTRIVEHTLQSARCVRCGATWRMDPEFTYLDLQRRQWILVKPASSLWTWSDLEDEARRLFDQAFGSSSGRIAREMGADIVPRIAFGWTALREKLLCAEHGLDDVALETLKLFLLATGEAPLADDVELRLAELDDQELVLVWIVAETAGLVETLRVPRALLDQVASDPEYQPLRGMLAQGPFVDLHRLLIERSPPENAPATAGAS